MSENYADSNTPIHPLEQPHSSPPPSLPKPPLIFIISTVFFLVGLSIFIYFSKFVLLFPSPPSLPSPLPTPQIEATVTYLIGNAWVLINDRKTELKENDTVSASAIILTDPASRLILRFDDGSIVSLDESSKITLTTLLPSNMVITNQTGTIFARVKKDLQHPFTIFANNYSVTAYGTIFAVENTDKVKVAVLESSVEVKDKDNNTLTVVNQHYQWDQDKTNPQPLPQNPNDFIAWSEKTTQNNPNSHPTPPSPPPTYPTSTTPTPPPTSIPQSTIKLSGAASATDIILNWQTTNISEGGFKIIKGLEPNPVYPGNDYVYLDNPSTRQYIWNIRDGQTYHFRICHYVNDKCALYSNDVTVTAPHEDNSSSLSPQNSSNTHVESITLSVSQDGTNARLSWQIVGNSPLGFKVVWSNQPNPVYPNREGDYYHYLDDPQARFDTISNLYGGKYYFRVCEYLGNTCGTYSNQVSLDY